MSATMTVSVTMSAATSAAGTPSVRDVRCDDRRMEPAARRERRRQLQITRRHRRNKIVENLIRQTFVKDAFVTIALKVEFQAFELDARLIGDVFDRNRAVVRLTRLGTQRRELGTNVRYEVVARRVRIVEEFESILRERWVNCVRFPWR